MLCLSFLLIATWQYVSYDFTNNKVSGHTAFTAPILDTNTNEYRVVSVVNTVNDLDNCNPPI